MNLTYNGHSSFLFEFSDGTRILTDPCVPRVGYELHEIECEAVTISHGHQDHNYFEAASGQPQMIGTAGLHKIGKIEINGVKSWHDENMGKLRGDNIMFCINGDGLKFVHLGDLGHMPSHEVVSQLFDADVLLMPVGGVFTIDAQQGLDVMKLIQPKLVIPMHFQTDQLKLSKPIDPLDKFLKLAEERGMEWNHAGATIEIRKDSPPKGPILVMDYACC